MNRVRGKNLMWIALIALLILNMYAVIPSKAHPAFEDYLSPLTYQIDMEDMLKTLEEKLNELRGPT